MLRNPLLRLVSRSITTATRLSSPIKVGDPLPSVVVHELTPKNDFDNVNIANLFKGKKGILFGVPGAFTPICHKSHLPGYVENYEKFASKGFDVVACISVNDAFVMDAWGKASNAAGKLKMLADTNAEFTKAADLVLDIDVLGGTRCKRFSMVIEDGIVKAVNIESASGGVSNSGANTLLEQV